MIDKYVRLTTALHKTRDDLLETCSLLQIDPEALDPNKLKIAQCVECSIWETQSQMRDDVCVFCDDMPDLRF